MDNKDVNDLRTSDVFLIEKLLKENYNMLPEKTKSFIVGLFVVGCTYYNKLWSNALIISSLQEMDSVETSGSPNDLPHPMRVFLAPCSKNNTYSLTKTKRYKKKLPMEKYERLRNEVKRLDVTIKLPTWDHARRKLNVMRRLVLWYIMNVDGGMFDIGHGSSEIILNFSTTRAGSRIGSNALTSWVIQMNRMLSELFEDCSENHFSRCVLNSDATNQIVYQKKKNKGQLKYLIKQVKEIKKPVIQKSVDKMMKTSGVEKDNDDSTSGSEAGFHGSDEDVEEIDSSVAASVDTCMSLDGIDDVVKNLDPDNINVNDDDDDDDNVYISMNIGDVVNNSDHENIDDDGNGEDDDVNGDKYYPMEENEEVIKDARNKRSTINEKKKNILLLGMSTVDVEGLTTEEVTVDVIKKLMTENRIEDKDARDLVRITGMKNLSSARNEIFTVSLVNSEKTGIMYDKKHLSCDFNTGKRFVERIRDKFGKTIQFEEVYLDYVYMPGGVSTMNLAA